MGENSSDIHAQVGDDLGQNVGVEVEVPQKPSTDVEGILVTPYLQCKGSWEMVYRPPQLRI